MNTTEQKNGIVILWMWHKFIKKRDLHATLSGTRYFSNLNHVTNKGYAVLESVVVVN